MIIKKTDAGSYPPIVEMAVTANESYLQGELLKVVSGCVTKCAATDAPVYFCEENTQGKEKGFVKCHLVYPFNHYETKSTADITSNPVGSKVTLDDSATMITATATGGVATITQKLTDTKAVVRFI